MKDRSVWRCQQCGFASPKPGTCPDCKRATGELMALVEERAARTAGVGRMPLAPSRPRPLREVYGYGRGWGTVGPEAAAEITRIMSEVAPQGDHAPA